MKPFFPILLSFLASPAVATPTCPTKADAMSPGVHIEFDKALASQYTVSADGRVTADYLGDEPWRYESIASVFLLRYGPLINSALDPEQSELARYQVPVDSLPAVAKGINWKGHVSYTLAGKLSWKTDMSVSTSPYPDQHIGSCVYEAKLITISEADEAGVYVTFLAFLPELGFGVQIGTFTQGDMEQLTPVSIKLIDAK